MNIQFRRIVDFVLCVVAIDAITVLAYIVWAAIFGTDSIMVVLKYAAYWMKIGLMYLYWTRVPFRASEESGPRSNLALKKILVMATLWPLVAFKRN